MFALLVRFAIASCGDKQIYNSREALLFLYAGFFDDNIRDLQYTSFTLASQEVVYSFVS